MLRFSVHIAPKDIIPQIERFLARQLPWAATDAINATTHDIRQTTLRKIRRKFHKPVKYMRKTAVFRYRASPRRPRGAVGIKDRQGAMYAFQEWGGRRRAARGKYHSRRGGRGGKMIPIPVNIRRNASDNMRVAAIKTALRRKRTFMGGPEEGLRPGVYERIPKRGEDELRTLVRFKRSVRYKPRLDWWKTVKPMAPIRFRHHFTRELSRRLARLRARTGRGAGGRGR